MTWLRAHPIFPGATLVFGLVAFLERPIAARRPAPPEIRAAIQLFVTSEKDTGPGSLRWAIFSATAAPDRVSIEVRTRRIVLETPLPPLLNPAGVVLRAQDAGVEIDGTSAPAGALLDVAAPASVISGLKLRGAAGQGILVRASGVVLRGLVLEDNEEGVHVLAATDGVTVEGTSFARNGTGVLVEPGASGVVIRDSSFLRHDKAGIWAVSPRPGSSGQISVVRNRFDEDRMSLVLIHVPARVEDNQFLRAAEAAAYVTGAPILHRNRVESGATVGIYADAADGALIEGNEVSNCATVGILLRQSRSTELRGNRLFGNGYGIALVLDQAGGRSLIADNLVLSQRVDGLFLVGASPVVQDNRIIGSRQAGVRILDYVPLQGARLAGMPVLHDNALRENRWDQLRGEYREPPEPKPRP